MFVRDLGSVMANGESITVTYRDEEKSLNDAVRKIQSDIDNIINLLNSADLTGYISDETSNI